MPRGQDFSALHLFFGSLLELFLLLLAARLLPRPVAASPLEQELDGPVLVPARVEERRSHLILLFSRDVHHLLDLPVLLLGVLVAADDLKRGEIEMKATGKKYIRCIRRESNEWPRYKLWLLDFIQINCFLLLQSKQSS